MANTYTPLRWGILGAGAIARRFCSDVRPLSDHQIAAVGSRDQEKADAFGDEFGIANRHASYEALVADPDVDVIYVATPHNFHREHALLALNAGKNVLCEKPFTINLGEAEEVVRVAREKNLFLMEGMWSRCFPIMARARELARSGAIGRPRLIEADFGFRGGKMGAGATLEGVNAQGRLYNPDLGGGALMDVGVYPVSLAMMFFGAPDSVAGLATLGETGVDENTGMLLHFPGGEIGVLHTSLQVSTVQKATLLGTDGRIEIHSPWWKPSALTVYANGKDPEKIEEPFEGGGFQFEAMHVAECLRAGKTESDIMPLDDTLAVMKTLDTLRGQIGLKYPME
jgi:Predicted dehydrogenases and related proteins